MVVLLGCFLIAVATGLISDNTESGGGSGHSEEPKTNGWGPTAIFEGRYKGRILAAGKQGGAGAFASGQLTLFWREIHKGAPLVQSGVLELHGATSELAVYLTQLSHAGNGLRAQINGGTYDGPVIGSFTGIRRGQTIVGTATLKELPDVEAEYVRFSHSAQP